MQPKRIYLSRRIQRLNNQTMSVYTMEYVISAFLKNSSITIITGIVALFFTRKYVPSPIVQVISVVFPDVFRFETRYLAPVPYPFIINIPNPDPSAPCTRINALNIALLFMFILQDFEAGITIPSSP